MSSVPSWIAAFTSIAMMSIAVATPAAAADDTITADDIARTRWVTSARISPDGALVAYVLSVPRTPCEDDDGGAWAELHVAGPRGRTRPFVTGEVHVGGIDWTPDGTGISFLAKRGKDEHRSLYVIPVDGGEARRVLSHDEGISAYSWSPDGARVAFLAREEEDKTRKKLERKGFKAEAYEEAWRPVRVWIAKPDAEDDEPRALEIEGSASELHWSPKGDRLAVAVSPTPSVDDVYMYRKVRVVDAETGETLVRFDNPGKLGPVAWSPDGEHLAIVSAEDLNDPAPGRLVLGAMDGELRDLLPDFEGHVTAARWIDPDTILVVADQGTLSVVATIEIESGSARTVVAPGGPVLGGVSLSGDGTKAAFVGESPAHPPEVFVRAEAGEPVRWTDSNPWLADKRLAPQEIVAYEARDGLKVEGILVRPLDENEGSTYPLVVIVHGGPEGHLRHGWVTSYSRPGQLLAARGFAVFYPNYRGSTGRGVEYTKLHQADYAGGEFNDVVDGVEHLVASGLVNRNRVGVTGGSYGGFATAWCATALSEHFAAGVMFVGISDHVSKAGTTDIPHEMYEVHARKWPWEAWDWYRERSPLYHVRKAKTPLLILHGENDTRVDPSQSMMLYRFLKLLDQAPVRLILYPGEGHGNRKAAARLDYTLRLVRWMERYLVGPGGDPPPVELPELLACVEEDDDDDEDGDGE
jgi:dipeptidyl aminopeptidase/acylaminoacyl peptidase